MEVQVLSSAPPLCPFPSVHERLNCPHETVPSGRDPVAGHSRPDVRPLGKKQLRHQNQISRRQGHRERSRRTLGHPLILEFWATWCPPCRESIPHLNQIHAKFKDRGLVIIGITKEDKSTVKKFLKGLPMNYAVALDSQGKFSGQFGIQGIPHAMMVDPSGTVVWEGRPASLRDSDISGLLKQSSKIASLGGSVGAPGNSTTPLPGWN